MAGLNKSTSKPIGWPAASTLIAAMAGAVAAAIALAAAPADIAPAPDRFASGREIGEVKARLTAIEQSSRQMRIELRGDIKELRDLIRQWMKEH